MRCPAFLTLLVAFGCLVLSVAVAKAQPGSAEVHQNARDSSSSSHSRPGGLEWTSNVSVPSNVRAPIRVNDSFVAVTGGAGTALVRLSDGATTFILPASRVAPVVAGGHVIIAAADTNQLISYDLQRGNLSWTAPFVDQFSTSGIVGHGDYLLAINWVSPRSSTLSVFDARTGALLYAIPFTDSFAGVPVVSTFGSVAFGYPNGFLIFWLDSGKILLNASTNCYHLANYNPLRPPLFSDNIFVSCDFVAYDARSGNQLWRAALPNSEHATREMVATATTIVSSPVGDDIPNHKLFVVAKATGELLKEVRLDYWNNGAQLWPTLSRAGDLVLASYSNITAFNGATGARLWNLSSSEFSFASGGLEHGHYVYLQGLVNGDELGAMVAVDATSGTIVGSWGSGIEVSSPLFVAGRMLFMASDGLLYCVTAF